MYMFLEKGMWDADFYSKVKSACVSLGVNYEEISFVECFNSIPKEKHDAMSNKLDLMKYEFVFPYGCINFVNHLKSKVEGVFWNKNFDFHVYSSYWHKYMLMKDNMGYFSTFGHVKHMPMLNLVHFHGQFFMRPDKGNKIFTGRVFKQETINHDLTYMGYNFPAEIPNEELVYVSGVEKIKREFRFAIIDGKIASSTLYNVNGRATEEPGCDNRKIIELANEVASDPWQPDQMYSLDICEYGDDKIAVLEIGCLNCSGWYKMNPQYIIKAISDWEDKYQQGKA